ncbi:MAG: polysaccharide deacetylase family protein [Cyclobacteriaceae bacterium]
MKFNTRNILAYFVAQSFIFMGLVNRAKKKALNGDHILSIYFHHPSKKEFEFTIQWLNKNGFTFISMEDLKKILKGTASFPKGAVLITSDDAWATNFSNMAPVAIQKKVPLTIFVPTEAIEEGNYWFRYAKQATKEKMKFPTSEEMKKLPNHKRMAILSEIKKKINLPREAMTLSEIRSITQSPWVSLGGHSHSHPILPNCDHQELHLELSLNKRKLEDWINKEIDTFAYPNGDFDVREKKALQKEGFQLGFSNKPDYLTPSALKLKHEIPRIGFLEGASNAENICRIVGVWHKNTLKLFSK